MKLRRLIYSIGWDGVFLGVCGLVALGLGILDFVPQLQLTKDPILRVNLSFVGLLLEALVIQNTQRRSELSELKSALGVVEADLLNSAKEFGQHLVPSVIKAKLFVLDTYLTHTILSSRKPRFSGTQGEYQRLLSQRVLKDEITFKYVTVIFHQEGLEDQIFKLLLHEGYKYYIRHYEPPPTPIPIINLMSFDDEAFYLGGFHTKEVAAEEQVLYIREPSLTHLLKNYWFVLWEGSTPLNEGGIINWAELRRISQRLGMTETEFGEVVSRVKEEVQRERRKLLRRA